jgi:endonuclease/exonuclease/phosphatase (EEP) superfamily protein YafD
MKLVYLSACATLVVYVSLYLVSFFAKTTLYVELAHYVLPYILVLNIVLCLILFPFVWNFKDLVLLRVLSVVLVVITLYLSFTIYQYSYVPHILAASGETEIRAAFLNKLYSNTNYSPILQKINALNPEILGMSEVTDEDLENLKLTLRYQRVLAQPARDHSNIVLASNYPTSVNEDMTIPFVLSAVSKINNTQYYIFVIHPEPPINAEWLKQRNQNLKKLSEYIVTLPQDRVIILGDFNLPQWSPVYQDFTSTLPQLQDSAKGRGMQFSWHGGVIRTSIDHIFVPKDASIEDFGSEYIDGSDHNMIWTKFMIND